MEYTITPSTSYASGVIHTARYSLHAEFNGENRSSLSFSKKRYTKDTAPVENDFFPSFSNGNDLCCKASCSQRTYRRTFILVSNETAK